MGDKSYPMHQSFPFLFRDTYLSISRYRKALWVRYRKAKFFQEALKRPCDKLRFRRGVNEHNAASFVALVPLVYAAQCWRIMWHIVCAMTIEIMKIH